jgi:hypothetical protein
VDGFGFAVGVVLEVLQCPFWVGRRVRLGGSGVGA